MEERGAALDTDGQSNSIVKRPVNHISAQQLTRALGSWTYTGVIYTDLAAAIREAITDGRLPPDIRIPAERTFAQALGASRNSVAAAYGVLRSEGYLRSRRGAGTFTSIPSGPAAGGRLRDSRYPGSRSGADDEIDLSLACPPPPETMLASALLEVALQGDVHTGGSGYDLVGIPALREVVADRFTRRGLPTQPSEIMITNGAQHAWSMLLYMFAGSGDRVLMEVPSFPTVQAAIQAVGARPVPVPVTAAGWDVEMIEAALMGVRPALGYLMPDFQNPTGHLMPGSVRRAIVRASRLVGTPLVVDDTLRELHLDRGPMPPPLASYAREGIVTVDSMSKVCWSGLRVGWIRAAPSLIDRLTRMRRFMDTGNPIVQQHLAVRMLEHYGELVASRRSELRTQRDTLAWALRDRMPEWSFTESAGGLSLWVDLGRPISTKVVRAAAGHGVRLTTGPSYGLHGTLERYLRIPYVLPPATLIEAVRRLEVAVGAISSEPLTPRL